MPPSASWKRPLAVRHRAGERALDVAEEFALEQVLGNRAAVERDQRALGAPAVVVDRARDEFLARAALAEDQDRRVAVGHLVDEIEHRAQRRALAHHVVEAVARAELVLEQPVLGAQPPVLDRLLDQAPHDVEGALERLVQVPEGAGAQRVDGMLDRVVAGHHDAGQVGVDFVDLPHQLEAADARHAHVAEHQIDRLGRDDGQRLAGVARAGDRVTAADEDALERAPIQLLVVDDQNMGTAQCRILRDSGGGGRIVGRRADPARRAAQASQFWDR